MTDATRSDPPAWLNLDAIVDEQTREQLAALTAETEALEPPIRDFAIRAFRLNVKTEKALAGLSAGVYDAVSTHSGFAAFIDALTRLRDHFEAAIGERPYDTVDWLEAELQEAGGVDWPLVVRP